MKAPSSETLSPVAPSTDQNAATAKVRLTRRTAAYWQVTFDNPPREIKGRRLVRPTLQAKM